MIKLNLGSGPHAIPGWINYDSEYHPGVTPLDLSKGILPHADNSVDYIFSEHAIEHFTKEQGINLLKECYRVLKKNTGALRLSTPNLKELAEAYLYSHRELSKGIPGIWEPKSPCDLMNEGMRLWGHKYLWDEEELCKTLIEIGFDEPMGQEERGDSIIPELCNLEVRPQHFEMYIEVYR